MVFYMVVYTRCNLKGCNINLMKIKFSKKNKKILKNFEKSVDKRFKMCYYSIVPARKQVHERKFVQNNLYLNSTMVRNNFELSSYQFQVF